MKLDTTKVTLENVDVQFCSDFLKSELRRLLRKELALARAMQTLTVIASEHKPALSEESFWELAGSKRTIETCVADTIAAREALAEIGKILGD